MAITKFGFTLFELEEFRAWITALSVPRTVKTIQQQPHLEPFLPAIHGYQSLRNTKRHERIPCWGERLV